MHAHQYNNLSIGNFAFKHSVKYTYSNGNYRSYIDHVLVPTYLMPTVRACVVLEVPSNTSDHMPIKAVISLELDNSYSAVLMLICPYTDWSNMEITKQYQADITKAAKQIKPIILNGIIDKPHARQVVTMLIDSFSDIINKSCKHIQKCVIYKGSYSQKSW